MSTPKHILLLLTLLAGFTLNAQYEVLEGYWLNSDSDDTTTLEIRVNTRVNNGDSIAVIAVSRKSSNSSLNTVLYIECSDGILTSVDAYGNNLGKTTKYDLGKNSFYIELLSDKAFNKISKRTYRKTNKAIKSRTKSQSESINQKDH